MADDRKFQALVIINFNGIDRKQIQCRRAYVSGLYIGLLMASQIIEARLTELPTSFVKFLADPKNQNLQMMDYLSGLSVASSGVIKLTEEDFQNSGLRFGIPGAFYGKGIWEAFSASIVERFHSTAWIDTQIDWLSNLVV